MIETTDQGKIQFTWQAMLWRLVLTGSILVALANSGSVLFDSVTERTGAETLPILLFDTDSALAR